MRMNWLAFAFALTPTAAHAEPSPDDPNQPQRDPQSDNDLEPSPADTPALVDEPASPPDDEDPDNPSTGQGPTRPPEPKRQKPPSPYAQGKMHIGLGGGLLSSRDRVDFGFEISYGYFVIDNIELGVDTAFQFGDSPFAAYLGPTVRVLFPVSAFVAPYLGGFYRHWFLTDGLADFDTLGVRAGLMVPSGVAHFYFGIVYEAIVSECTGACGDLYPELGVAYFF